MTQLLGLAGFALITTAATMVAIPLGIATAGVLLVYVAYVNSGPVGGPDGGSD